MPTVLVTGANRGLGLCFARHYADAGWRVIGACRVPEAAAELRALPGTLAMKLDLARPDSIEALAGRLAGAPLDLLVANAATLPTDEQLREWGMDAVMRVNLDAQRELATRLRPNLAAGTRPVLAFLSSRDRALDPAWRPGFRAYFLSKQALNAAMRRLATEGAPLGIVTVGLYPGWVRTEMGGGEAPIAAGMSVAGLARVIERLTAADNGRMFDWTGQALDP